MRLRRQSNKRSSAEELLSPAQEQSALSSFAQNTGKLLTDALWVLDTPRAVVASAADSLINDGLDFSEFNNPFDADQRLSSRDVLEEAGLLEEDTWTGFGVGLGADILTDPLTWATMGANALTQSGRAARALGVLDDAPKAASRALQKRATELAKSRIASSPAASADDLARSVGDAYAKKSLVKQAAEDLGVSAKRAESVLGDTPLNQADPDAIRSLVGKREARRTQTLEDVIEASEDSDALREALESYANKYELDADELLQGTLGKSFGAGIPGMKSMQGAADLLGEGFGRTIARTGDAVGDYARQSWLGRQAARGLNRVLGNQVDMPQQELANRIVGASDVGEGKARELINDIGLDYERLDQALPDSVKQQYNIDSLWSKDAGEILDRVIEGRVATDRDRAFVAAAGLDEIVDKYGKTTLRFLQDSKNAGLNAHRLNTGYVKNYRPYQIRGDLKPLSQGERPPAALYDTFTGDMLERQEMLQLPGGIDQARYIQRNWRNLLEDAGLNADEMSDSEIGNFLYNELNDLNSAYVQGKKGSVLFNELENTQLYNAARDKVKTLRQQGADKATIQNAIQEAARLRPLGMKRYSRGKATGLANYLRDLPDGEAVFNNHPLDALSQYALGRERAIGTGNELIDIIGNAAQPGVANTIKGGGRVPIMDALNQVGLKTSREIEAPAKDAAAELTRATKEYDDAVKAFTVGKAGKPSATQAEALKAAAAKGLSPTQVVERARKAMDKARQAVDAPANPKYGNIDGGAGQRVQEIIAKNISEQTGQPVKASDIDLKKFNMRQEDINHLRNLHDSFTTSKRNDIFSGIEDFTRTFKSQILLFPKRYSRDLMSAYISNLVESGSPIGLTSSYGTARHLVNGNYAKVADDLLQVPAYANIADPDQRLKAFMNDAAKFKMFGGLRTEELIDDPAAESIRTFIPGAGNQGFTSSAKKIVNNLSLGQFIDKESELMQAGQSMANFTDRWSRMSGYINLMKQGNTAEEAARRMMRIHVDYSDLSKSELWLRKFIPFYSYTGKIARYAVDQLLTNPGGPYSQGLRSVNRIQESDDDTFVPEYIRSGTGFRVPDELLTGINDATGIDVKALSGLNPEDDYYVTSFDYPGAQALQIPAWKKDIGNPLPNVVDSLTGTAQNIFAQAAPVYRSGYEIMTGEDAFYKKPLNQTETNFDKILKGGYKLATGDDPRDYGAAYSEDSPLANNLWSAVKLAADAGLPGFSRFFGMAGKIMDPVEGQSGMDGLPSAIGRSAIDAFMPVRAGGVRPDARDRAFDRAVGESLKNLPQAYTAENTYLKKDLLSTLNPGMRNALLARKAAQKRLRNQ